MFPIALITAISAFKIKFPKDRVSVCLSKNSSSKGQNPPSGPIIQRHFSPFLTLLLRKYFFTSNFACLSTKAKILSKFPFSIKFFISFLSKHIGILALSHCLEASNIIFCHLGIFLSIISRFTAQFSVYIG